MNIFMQHYVLLPNISRQIMEFLGLPYESIREKGVVYLDAEDVTWIGDDHIEHHSVNVWFKYINDSSEVIYLCWGKKYFDLFFAEKRKQLDSIQ